MKGRCYAIIFFVVIGINAIYSLPHTSDLHADSDSREGRKDFDSNVDVFDEAAGGRFKRDRIHDYNAREKKTHKDNRIADLRMNARNERSTQPPGDVFQQVMQGTIEQLMRNEDALAPARMTNFQAGRLRN